ncbi:MAG: hypothetical protein IT431_03280 [Phycisphaerales bacterium]|nr:hypothetical protein [Phycisphaerales bacterium]
MSHPVPGNTALRLSATTAVRGTNIAGVRAEQKVDQEPCELLQLERRAGDRSRARGQGIGTFVDPDGRLWLTRVALIDRGGDGMGVRCPVPVAAGASFHLSVEGSMVPLQGVVAHSRGRGGAYRLGLRCARRQAA